MRWLGRPAAEEPEDESGVVAWLQDVKDLPATAFGTAAADQHPTLVMSITAADGRAIGDLQITTDLRTAATAVRTMLAELSVREQ